MNRKLILSGMVLLALVLTTGTFAYTYAGTATATLNATVSSEDVVTYQPSTDQPDWESLMPDGEYADETLVPCAAGDVTDISWQSPLSGEHWDKVDDMPADDGATYVATGARQYQTDLYNLTDDAVDEEGVVTEIKSITVYFRFNGDRGARAKAVIKTHGAIFEGREESLNDATFPGNSGEGQPGGDFATRSYQWVANPITGKRWTWEEVNDLQAGVSLKVPGHFRQAACTQVYVGIDYEFRITEGDVPEGSLYDITPHPDYTGDMQVKIYLTNTGSLLKAYRYLNLELYVKNSLEAGKSPRYQLLSLENGVAAFNIQGGSAASYTVEVWGGSYRLVSDKSSDWGEGWSMTPEFYCEVTQR
jgi:hypothetical protein